MNVEKKTKFDPRQFVGQKLEEAASMLATAGYKVRVVAAGVPVRLTEEHNPGRVTVEVEDGKVTHVRIG